MSTAAGVELDTSGMTMFETGDRWIPSVFLSADRRRVLVRMLDAVGAAHVVPASSGEIKRLARRYRLPGLLDALQASVRA